MDPIGRCNADRADFDLRADFEALTNADRDRQDHRASSGGRWRTSWRTPRPASERGR
jgi:hypothetical protein